MTSDNEEAQEWVRELTKRNGGRRGSATMTVDVVEGDDLFPMRARGDKTVEPNYIQGVIDMLSWRLPDCDADLLRFYALLVLVRGTATSLEDVHDAWAAWRNSTRPDHAALVPFSELDPATQELDRKYADAIRQVAARVATQ